MGLTVLASLNQWVSDRKRDKSMLRVPGIGKKYKDRRSVPVFRKSVPSTLLFIFFCVGTIGWKSANTQTTNADFVCGGTVENSTWQLWDSWGVEYIRTGQIIGRLQANGDTQALYDIQAFVHNIVQMARICGRTDRLIDIAKVLALAYDELEPDGKWICRGGKACTVANKLLDTEVVLYSSQYLGLVSAIANGLIKNQNPEAYYFREKTAVTALQFLGRQASLSALSRLDLLMTKTPQDVTKTSSWVFYDVHLWHITILSELAGILNQNPEFFTRVTADQQQLLELRSALRSYFTKLLALFQKRTTILNVTDRPQTADIDQGFRKLTVEDGTYAGYSGSIKPIECIKKRGFSDRYRRVVNIDPVTVPVVDTLGWDISHARRLVHAFQAIELNRQAITDVFWIDATLLPTQEIMQKFARQWLYKIWNGDEQHPLFSNFTDGTNGWYRVGYNNRCFSGYAPFALSLSFPTGGYITWQKYAPGLKSIGRRLYELSFVNDPFFNSNYLNNNYLGGISNTRLFNLMFWPTLVEAPAFQ